VILVVGLCVIVDSCESETERVIIDGQVYGAIIWPASSIGTAISLSCPCDSVKISQKAYRTCGGDFVSGATWLQSELSDCKLSKVVQQACVEVSQCFLLALLMH